MLTRSLRLSALVALMSAAPMAQAITVTTPFATNASVGLNGVSRVGSTPNSRFAYVGGNSTTSPPNNTSFPSFVAYDVNGAGVLQQFRTAIGNDGGTVTSIDSLSLQLYDEGGTGTTPTAGTTTGVAGGFDFSYASSVTALTVGNTTPTYDPTDVGGLTTQLGPVIGLGSGAYTPTTLANAAIPAYSIGSTAGNAAILAAVNAGATFRIVIDANTPATRATLSGYFGLAPFITAPSLTITGTAVPEPTCLGLSAVGVAGLLRRRRTIS